MAALGQPRDARGRWMSTGGGGAATLAVQIVGDASSAQRALGGLSTGIGSLGRGLATVGAAALAAGAATATAAAVGMVKLTQAASASEQAMGGLDSVFRVQAGVMRQHATEAARTSGLSATAYAQMASVIGSQLSSTGRSMAQVAPETHRLITLGGDLAATFGGDTSEAVQALAAALRGERDPIERYGVSLTQAAVESKALAMGLKKTGKAWGTEAIQAATMALIYEQTAAAQGQMAREYNTVAAAGQRARAMWENSAAALGQALLPAAAAAVSGLADLATVIGPILTPVMERLGAVLSAAVQHIIALAPAVVGAVQWLAGLATSAGATTGPMAQLMGTAQAAGQTLMSGLVPAGQALISALVQLAAAVGPPAAQIAGMLMPAAAQVVPVLVQVTTAVVQAATQIMQALAPAMTTIASAVIPALTSAIRTIGPPVMEVISAIGGLVAAIVANAMPVIQALLPVVTFVFRAVAAVGGAALSQLAAVIRTITAVIRGDWQGAWQGMGQVFAGAMSVIQAIGQQAMAALRGLIGQATSIGSGIVSGIASGIRSGASAVIGAATSIATSAIHAAKSALGIASPSREFALLGRQVVAGYVQGLTGGGRQVDSAVRGLLAPPTTGGLAPAGAAGAGGVTIVVQGALDPDAVARQIRRILTDSAVRRGAEIGGW